MKPELKKYLLYISAAIVVGILLFLIEETIRAKNTGFEVKTLWDWMELLVIPLFLAGGAYYLNRSERENERVIAIDRQREAAFQTYIDRMADLLLKDELRTTENKEVQDVARTRTLSVLRGLDANRKTLLIQFLVEAQLIGIEKPVISLKGASLNGADLMAANLMYTNLMYADLSNADLTVATLAFANLKFAKLSHAYLNDASLMHADLSGANLMYADLSNTELNNADLSGANLTGASVYSEQLEEAKSLKGATMPNGTKHK